MPVYDTPEKIARRLKQTNDENIKRLLSLHNKKHGAGDYAGAEKIAWILAKKYNIEGDHRYDLSLGNCDCEG